MIFQQSFVNDFKTLNIVSLPDPVYNQEQKQTNGRNIHAYQLETLTR